MPPRGLLNAFLPLLSYRFLFCSLAFHRPNACMPVCRQAGTRAGRLAGGRTGRQECPPPGKKECLPVRKSESLQAGSYAFFTCVAAFGAVVAACGVFEPYFRPGKRPTFAPKRQGKAESAYRRPRLRPSFGQQKGIGQPMPCRVGNDRSIPNPSGTDFCVLEDTARCPLSYSKGFGLLPKRPCPSRGGLPLRSREACFHLRCGCRSYAYAVTPLNPL